MVCVGTKVFQGMEEFSQNMKKKKLHKIQSLIRVKIFGLSQEPKWQQG